MAGLRGVARASAALGAALGTAAGAHMLLVLGAAVSARRRPAPSPADALGLAVLVPAHDEEEHIATTIASLQRCVYPAARWRLVVVADNCTDQTAAEAQAAGAEVWERHSDSRRGKGHALAWAFPKLLDDQAIDAVCVVDADCEVSENLLGALAARLDSGAELAQASYLISNPGDSPGAALRWAGFALFNVIRPMGRSRLGLSSGLLGTGMAVSRRLLLRSPWAAFSFAEDREQHMRWVMAGATSAFAPEAEVIAPAVAGTAGQMTQEARWESGRGKLIARWSPQLLGRWLRTGDVTALDAALEPALPPQSLLLANGVLAVVLAALSGSRQLVRWAATAAVAQVVYVVAGLLVLDAPAPVWRALVSTPGFVIRRFAVLVPTALGRGPSEWQRTPREERTPGVSGASSTRADPSARRGGTTESSSGGC